MFDHWFRVLKDRLLAPVAGRVGRWVHPNLISLAALLVGIGCALLAARGAYGPALAAWIVNRILDGLDGSVARAAGTQSDFGGYLDIVLDFIVYAAVPIGLAAGAPSVEVLRAGLLLLASFFVNAASWMYLAAVLERRHLGAGATGERTTITMPPGLIAGTETVVFYSLFLLWPERLAPLFTLMAALVMVNVVQRLWWARRRI